MQVTCMFSEMQIESQRETRMEQWSARACFLAFSHTVGFLTFALSLQSFPNLRRLFSLSVADCGPLHLFCYIQNTPITILVFMDFFFFFFLLSISCLCLPKHVMLLFLPLLLFRISYGCYCAGGLIWNPVGGAINPLSLGTRSTVFVPDSMEKTQLTLTVGFIF